jgi:hypothetical protein
LLGDAAAAVWKIHSSRRITFRGAKEVKKTPATPWAARRDVDARQKAIQVDAAVEAAKNRGRQFSHWRSDSPKGGLVDFHIPVESYVGWWNVAPDDRVNFHVLIAVTGIANRDGHAITQPDALSRQIEQAAPARKPHSLVTVRRTGQIIEIRVDAFSSESPNAYAQRPGASNASPGPLKREVGVPID